MRRPAPGAFDEVGKCPMTRQQGDDADKQDDRNEADGVFEHIGYGWRVGEFGPVERHAVPTEQDGYPTEQAPNQESDPETCLADKILDTGRN
jgi:hypothetical protein